MQQRFERETASRYQGANSEWTANFVTAHTQGIESGGSEFEVENTDSLNTIGMYGNTVRPG